MLPADTKLMRRISLCCLGFILAGGCAFDGSEGSEPPDEAPIATPLPPGGTLTISGTIASTWVDPPDSPPAHFGVVLVNKDTPALAPQDCYPRQVTPVAARADRTFTISNVASGAYYVLAFRHHNGSFERTSVDVTISDQSVTLTPISLLAPLSASIDDKSGPSDREVVSWSAPTGASGFKGMAFRGTSADACELSGGALKIKGTYQSDIPDNVDLVRVLIEKGEQVAIRVEAVDD